MRMPWQKREMTQIRREPQKAPKKQGCKIKFKKTATGEEMIFSPECRPDQIEMARRMREKSRKRSISFALQ